MSRIQLRLMAVLAGLVLAVVLTTGWLAERGLRAREIASIERSLEQRTELVRAMLGDTPLDPARLTELDAFADRAGEAAGARVTLIAPDGRVLGDSEVATSDLLALENHSQRPEIRTARTAGAGISRRPSRTVARELLYFALAAPAAGEGAVVRLAVDLAAVDQQVAGLRRRLLASGTIGLLGVLVLSYLISWITLRPVEEMRHVVRAIAEGKLERRLTWRGRDELGEIAGSINRMAEQLRQRLDEATAEKEQLEAVLASMVEGVLVLENGRLVLANPRARELLSIWGEIEGRRPLEVIRHAEIDSGLEEAARSGEPVLREIEVGNRTPRRLLMHAVSFPRGPRPTGTVAVFHDVTEIRRLEEVRRDFIANASHELRTPLTAIQGFADTLLGASLSPDESRRYIEVIVRNADRLRNLIEDLLALSRIESGRSPMRRAEVDVVRVAETLASDTEPRVREAGIDLQVDAAAPALAWADRQALEQVISNLLDNAIKYTDRGGRITLRIRSDRDRVRVVVEDTGIGIPQEELGRIFERFYRVDKARSRALGGTGLGLAIVKHLVQAMGGELRVTSQVGVGTSFQFSVPSSPEIKEDDAASVPAEA